MNKVRTRFAPSPTGFLHIGGLRTALYAYALAKHNKGEFVLRIEDTDQKREVKGAVDALKITLQKFGLQWDEFYIQSERLDKYREAGERLVKSGNAFYCNCKPKNAKESGFATELKDPCRNKSLTSGAIKLKVPNNKMLSYFDFVHRKEITWSSDTVYDATLLKSDGYPTYHLAVAVDDLDMKVSHILRGHDWLPSTPIHLLVFDYLGGKRPEIGHLTDILSSETGKKLSKRRDSVFAEQFLNEGYLPEALLNFIMLLGWAPKDNRELFTLEEFVKAFDINGFQEANPRFFKDKLDWFNGHYIRQKSDNELKELLKPFIPNNVSEALMDKIIPLTKSRMKKLSDFQNISGFMLGDKLPTPQKLTPNYTANVSLATISRLERIPEGEWNTENLNTAFKESNTVAGTSTSDFFMDVRGTISGKSITPPITESAEILGKDKTISQFKRGYEMYSKSKK